MPTDALLADEEALASTMGLHGGDRLWSAVPFSHSYGFTTLALSAIVRGLTLVVPGDLEPFSSLGAARKLGVTVFPTVPAYIQALLRLPDRLNLARKHSTSDCCRCALASRNGVAFSAGAQTGSSHVLRFQ